MRGSFAKLPYRESRRRRRCPAGWETVEGGAFFLASSLALQLLRREIAKGLPALLHVEVEVVLVRVVRLRSKRCSEYLARAGMDRAQERRAFIASAPMVQNSDALALFRDELADIEGVGESVLADAQIGIVIARAAVVGRHVGHANDAGVQVLLGLRLNHAGGPALQSLGQPGRKPPAPARTQAPGPSRCSSPLSRMGAGEPHTPSLIGPSASNRTCSPDSRLPQSARPASTSAALHFSGGGGGPIGSAAAPAARKKLETARTAKLAKDRGSLGRRIGRLLALALAQQMPHPALADA